ncbi:hypothetical protein BCD67_09010 [Oscillatoriales cyanobacterium USR001]|nr:hypothetical protein BCD67_09010 [Oscillatoriales cyanobacterium USR001]
MVYQKNVNCFIEVMKNQSDLFTETDWIELAEIADQILEDDDEELWQKISDWLKLHPDVKTAHKTYLKPTTSLASLDTHLGPGGSKPEESSDEPSSDPTLLKKLKNEIHRHKPDPSKQSP